MKSLNWRKKLLLFEEIKMIILLINNNKITEKWNLRNNYRKVKIDMNNFR